jgi:hypothetical protein
MKRRGQKNGRMTIAWTNKRNGKEKREKGENEIKIGRG